jgi:hypothetical protein
MGSAFFMPVYQGLQQIQFFNSIADVAQLARAADL